MKPTPAQLEELAHLLDRLYTRWEDEKQYEDFAEYRKRFEKGITDLQGTLTSFTDDRRGFRVDWTDGEGQRRYVRCNKTQATWGRYGRRS